MSAQLSLETATELACRALPAFGMGNETTLELVKYRENHVFHARGPQGEHAVRLHRLGLRSEQQLSAELQLLTTLERAGVPVPAVVPTLDGALFTRVHEAQGPVHLVDVQLWAQDTRPSGSIEDAFTGVADTSAVTFAALGRLAAQLHQSMIDLPLPEAESRPHWNRTGFFGPRAEWGDPLALALGADDRDVIASAITRLDQRLAEASTAREAYGMIHADFTPENVLVRQGPRGAELLVIDFDDFGLGWHAFDLATALFFYLPHPSYPLLRDGLLEGYRSVRGQRPGVEELLPSMLLARGLTYLGWAASRRGDETAEFIAGDVVPLVARLAREYVLAPAPLATATA